MEKDQDNVHQILNNIFKNRGRSKRKIKLNYKHIDSLNSLILGSQSNENSDSDFNADDEKTCEGESSSRTIHKKEKRRKLSTQMKKRPPSKSHNFDGKLFPDRNERKPISRGHRNKSKENLSIDIIKSKSFKESHKHFGNEKQSFFLKWKDNAPDQCCICLDRDAEEGNELVICDGLTCSFIAHTECYGIREKLTTEKKWFCDACQSPDRELAHCVVCPDPEGALRSISPGKFLHLVCAAWIPEIVVEDEFLRHGADTSRIPSNRWTKECYLCEDLNKSKIGCKMMCEAGGCRRAMHITCALKYSLLEEIEDDHIANPFFIYCKEHSSHENPRLNSWAKWVINKKNYYKEESLRIQHESWLPQILENQVKLISEAQSSQIHWLTMDITRLRGLHYEISKELKKSVNREFVEDSNTLSKLKMEIEELRNNLDSLMGMVSECLSEILPNQRKAKQHTHSQHSSNDIDYLVAHSKNIHFKPSHHIYIKNTLSNFIASSNISHQTIGSESMEIDSKRKRKSKLLPMICKNCQSLEDHRPYTFVTCTECQSVYHLSCLDPPLTKIKKGYAWRCADCDSSESEDDGDIIPSVRSRRKKAKT